MCVPINISGERWLLVQRSFDFNRALFSAIFYSQLLLHDLQPDKLGRWISRLGLRSFQSWDTSEETKWQITVSKKWKSVHFQGTYSVSWSYQGPPGCVWLYRGGERVTEAYVANIMVPFFPHLRFCQDDAIQWLSFPVVALGPRRYCRVAERRWKLIVLDAAFMCCPLPVWAVTMCYDVLQQCVALSQFE